MPGAGSSDGRRTSISSGDGGRRSDASRRLLAVDAGLRAGIAIYRGDGRLEAYRSTNFGALSRLKRGVYSVMYDVDGLAEVVVEGGGTYADPWLREIERRGIRGVRVDAGIWRERLLLPRDRRSGVDAKEQADVVARRIIRWSKARNPTSLRHDASEAILIGLWGVLRVGWIEAVPSEVLGG